MGKNCAIAIGINHYCNLQRLHYAKRDAESVRDYFEQEQGFHPVYYFSDDSPPIQPERGSAIDSQPTYATLRRFFRVRFEQPFLSSGDNLWFFFAGHGVRYEERDYLMPLDGDPGDIENTAIPLYYITERLRRCGADNIVLLIDACRSQSGRRDGIGIGKERQQGVITFFSCSPRESSYEIEALQQGSFTHALLQGLRLQGEGNCATVERLSQYLRIMVPRLNQCYQKPSQTPYEAVEPASKYHLILLPQIATVRDAEILKLDAFRAEQVRDYGMAEQYWIRVLMVSPGDRDGIEAIRRLALMPAQQRAQSLPSEADTLLPSHIAFLSSRSGTSLDENNRQFSQLTKKNPLSRMGNLPLRWNGLLLVMLSFSIFAVYGIYALVKQLQVSSVVNDFPLPIAPNPTPSLPPSPTDANPSVFDVDDTSELTILAIRAFGSENLEVGFEAVTELLERGALQETKAVLDEVPDELIDHHSISFLQGRLVWEFIKKDNADYSSDDALRFWLSAVSGSPDNMEYQNALGFSYYNNDRPLEAVEVWCRVLFIHSSVTLEDKSNVSNTLEILDFPSCPLPDHTSDQLVLNAIAGIALALSQIAMESTGDRQLSFFDKSRELYDLILKNDPLQFQPTALSQNWLWTELMIAEWRTLSEL